MYDLQWFRRFFISFRFFLLLSCDKADNLLGYKGVPCHFVKVALMMSKKCPFCPSERNRYSWKAWRSLRHWLLMSINNRSIGNEEAPKKTKKFWWDFDWRASLLTRGDYVEGNLRCDSVRTSESEQLVPAAATAHRHHHHHRQHHHWSLLDSWSHCCHSSLFLASLPFSSSWSAIDTQNGERF